MNKTFGIYESVHEAKLMLTQFEMPVTISAYKGGYFIKERDFNNYYDGVQFIYDCFADLNAGYVFIKTIPVQPS